MLHPTHNTLYSCCPCLSPSPPQVRRLALGLLRGVASAAPFAVLYPALAAATSHDLQAAVDAAADSQGRHEYQELQVGDCAGSPRAWMNHSLFRSSLHSHRSTPHPHHVCVSARWVCLVEVSPYTYLGPGTII